LSDDLKTGSNFEEVPKPRAQVQAPNAQAERLLKDFGRVRQSRREIKATEKTLAKQRKALHTMLDNMTEGWSAKDSSFSESETEAN